MSDLSEADRHLLAEVHAGRPEGWSRLVSRYQGRLLAFARARLANAADADDAVQETFLGFLRGLAQFGGRGGLESYLFAILRRKIVDIQRGRPLCVCSLQESLPGEGDGSAAPLGSRLAGPDRTASWHARQAEGRDELRDLLWAVLGELVDRLRQTLNFRDLEVAELVFYAQLRNRDIAKVLDLDERLVALLKHRFLKRIAAGVASRRVAAGDLGEDVESAAPPDDSLLTELWEEQRPSCPKRSTLGAFLLGTLDGGWRDYVDFHVNRLGCRFCVANLADLDPPPDPARRAALADRIMQSTVGFLRPC